MSEAQALAQLHTEYIASMTGTTLGAGEVVVFSGGLACLAIFFMFFVFFFTPIIEKSINWLVDSIIWVLDRF